MNKTPKEKIEELAKELEQDPNNSNLSTILFIIAGSTLLGPRGVAALTAWLAAWAENIIEEAKGIQEESKLMDADKPVIIIENDK